MANAVAIDLNAQLGTKAAQHPFAMVAGRDGFDNLGNTRRV